MADVPLLEIKHLEKKYENGFQAVSDVSFTLPPGKLVGLIGPNGCGKTTMMRCINRMHQPTGGDIFIDGVSVLDKTPAQVARLVSNVPAEMTVSFGLTVFETVMLGRYPFLQNVWWETDEDETLVEDTLKKFGVYHLQDRPLNMLSSGERQRVLIAKAYVQNPRLMLVDEPTSHLDMKYKLDVMEYLRAMVRQDMTVLVAEHDISLMARYCDLCIIMKKGRLVQIGDPKQIITSDLVRDVYDVNASVGFDRDGEIYVLPKRYIGEYHL
ncbi:MAG: ABC transporter ATP-binding protein [Candidatus Methanomethylophilus sp.]|nr:ABC transporter ATP-binding protein [Methanomethylophilus sp.]MDD3232719.1 ABC transporter ATP-binding protein [Methanomethylophilus sp.]MDD4221863.1 ABC transporter ATP-binding protein [Methanomethylophilus sp.]MDD4668404.1 ABC transporter ATP-binding protein [Methanomethylophilus sp.]